MNITHRAGRTLIGLGAVALALTLSGCSSSSSSSTTTSLVIAPGGSTAVAQANVTCNKAILADAPITAADLKACNKANVPSPNPCQSGATVYQAYVPGGSTALLKLGSKPVVYSSDNFYTSSITQLCGDPVDPTATPTPAPLTQAQVKALFPNGA